MGSSATRAANSDTSHVTVQTLIKDVEAEVVEAAETEVEVEDKVAEAAADTIKAGGPTTKEDRRTATDKTRCKSVPLRLARAV